MLNRFSKALHENQPAIGCILILVCLGLMATEDLTTRLHWLYWPGTILVAFIAFWILKKQGQYANENFISYLLQRNVWLHSSAVNDYIFVSLNALLFMKFIKYMSANPNTVAQVTYALLNKLPFEHNLMTDNIGTAPSIWITLAYTAVHVIVLDFALFFAHYLLHKVPILWALHKVHHSAEVLTPVTAYRIHPLELVFTFSFGALATGLVYGVFFYFHPSIEGFITIMGVSAATVVFNILGANLRHSHVWLSYGPKIESFLISPAQHHLHHSAKLKHADKNMGIMFSVWDRLFGTLYICHEKEDVPLGLGTRREQEAFSTVWGMLVQPLKDIAYITLGTRPAKKPQRSRQ